MVLSTPEEKKTICVCCGIEVPYIINLKYCSSCRKERDREFYKKYHNENREKIREYRKKNLMRRSNYNREWHLKNREHKSLMGKIYREKNKEKLSKQGKEWREKNKDKIRKYNQEHNKLPEVKAYRREHQKKNKHTKNKYARKVWKDDYKHRTNKLMSYQIRTSLKKQNISKEERHWEDLVDYKKEDLINHLEKQFTKDMAWSNQGIVWHIDHRIPKSWFKFNSTKDISFKQCWALENLQPKLATNNLIKNNKFAEPTLNQIELLESGEIING